MKKCIVFAAGSSFGLHPEIKEGDLVIAADAGIENCLKVGITPHLAVGDWDSASPPDLPKIDLKVEKDDTDTLAALRIGLEKGFDEFHIYCGTGGARLDHTIANLQSLLFLSKRGKRGFIHDENQTVTALTDGEIFFGPLPCGSVSVFAADGKAIGVTEEGMKYKTNNITLTCDFPLGVSNSFVGKPVRIAVKSGTLLIFYPNGAVIEGEKK